MPWTKPSEKLPKLEHKAGVRYFSKLVLLYIEENTRITTGWLVQYPSGVKAWKTETGQYTLESVDLWNEIEKVPE